MFLLIVTFIYKQTDFFSRIWNIQLNNIYAPTVQCLKSICIARKVHSDLIILLFDVHIRVILIVPIHRWTVFLFRSPTTYRKQCALYERRNRTWRARAGRRPPALPRTRARAFSIHRLSRAKFVSDSDAFFSSSFFFFFSFWGRPRYRTKKGYGGEGIRRAQKKKNPLKKETTSARTDVEMKN